MSDKILTLISKLLAVREERGATEAEQVIAAEQVQRLLQEHNLTLSQVEAHGSQPEGKRTKERTGKRVVHKHQVSLMACLADNNFCLHRVTDAFPRDGVITILVKTNPRKEGSRGHENFALYQTGMTVAQALSAGVEFTHLAWDVERGFLTIEGGTDRSSFRSAYEQHTLVGREINVSATRRTYDYLLNAIARCADESGCKGPDRVLFEEGAVSRLTERLCDLRRERELASKAEPPKTNGTGRELVLSDVYGSEADLNNDFLNGFPTGTTAAKRLEGQRRAAEREVERERLVAEGVDSTEAWYRSHGYSVELAKNLVKSTNRRSRRGGGRGRSQNWTRGDDAHYRRINSTAYRAGRTVGGSISLNEQVGSSDRQRIGRV